MCSGPKDGRRSEIERQRERQGTSSTGTAAGAFSLHSIITWSTLQMHIVSPLLNSHRTFFGRLDSLARRFVLTAHWLNSTLSNDIYLFAKLEPAIRALFFFFAYKIYIVAVWSVFGTRCDRSAPLLHLDQGHTYRICVIFTMFGMSACRMLAAFRTVFWSDFYFGDSVYCLKKFCSLSFSHPLYVDGGGGVSDGGNNSSNVFQLFLAADNLFVDIIFVAFSTAPILGQAFICVTAT